jgi:hypothetical protein
MEGHDTFESWLLGNPLRANGDPESETSEHYAEAPESQGIQLERGWVESTRIHHGDEVKDGGGGSRTTALGARERSHRKERVTLCKGRASEGR